jgi:tRNA (guanine-N7-)-methyltransferase
MWTGAKKSFLNGDKNVAFLRTNIEMITSFFAENEVSEIWITFPDPQMKKVRKRLTSTAFMERYQQIMKENGIIHLKTDSPFLYTYTTLMVDKNKYAVNFATDDLYHSSWNNEILSIKTHYEKQWLERGLSIKYIQFNLSKRTEFVEVDEEIEKDNYKSYNRRGSNLD